MCTGWTLCKNKKAQPLGASCHGHCGWALNLFRAPLCLEEEGSPVDLSATALCPEGSGVIALTRDPQDIQQRLNDGHDLAEPLLHLEATPFHITHLEMGI